MVIQIAILEAKLGIKRLALAQDILRLEPERFENGRQFCRRGRAFKYSTMRGAMPRSSSSASVSRDFEQRGL
jgi:hypothetical protein